MSIPQCNILEIRDTSVNDGIYVFDWVFLEIPMKSCILGMLLACLIKNGWCWRTLIIFSLSSPTMEEAKEIHQSLKRAAGIFIYVKVSLRLILYISHAMLSAVYYIWSVLCLARLLPANFFSKEMCTQSFVKLKFPVDQNPCRSMISPNSDVRLQIWACLLSKNSILWLWL